LCARQQACVRDGRFAVGSYRTDEYVEQHQRREKERGLIRVREGRVWRRVRLRARQQACVRDGRFGVGSHRTDEYVEQNQRREKGRRQIRVREGRVCARQQACVRDGRFAVGSYQTDEDVEQRAVRGQRKEKERGRIRVREGRVCEGIVRLRARQQACVRDGRFGVGSHRTDEYVEQRAMRSQRREKERGLIRVGEECDCVRDSRLVLEAASLLLTVTGQTSM